MASDKPHPFALILSGGGRYSDTWHDFPATSERVADILRERGFTVEISDDVDERLSSLDDVDLLVTNMVSPAADAPVPDAAASNREDIFAYIRRGGPILALHISSWAFPDIAQWTEHLGGRYVMGTSSHPDNGPSHIHAYPDRHPIVSTIGDFDLVDERYCFLELADDVEPLLSHHLYDVDHPLLWARTHHDARVVYSALGHSTDSFDSPEHREIVGRAALWLVDTLD